jgi:hypothetical protein
MYAWDHPSKLTKRWKSMPSLMYPMLHVHDDSHDCSLRGNSTMLSLSPILMVRYIATLRPFHPEAFISPENLI